VAEKEEAQSLEKQMESIGEGVDSIVEEGKKLKAQNDALTRELDEQLSREKELDEEVEACQRELEGYRQKIDEWERTKIKWNRRKKELLELISDAEKQVSAGKLESMN
jgi:chromosome segregation ATPase